MTGHDDYDSISQQPAISLIYYSRYYLYLVHFFLVKKRVMNTMLVQILHPHHMTIKYARTLKSGKGSPLLWQTQALRSNSGADGRARGGGARSPSVTVPIPEGESIIELFTMGPGKRACPRSHDLPPRLEADPGYTNFFWVIAQKTHLYFGSEWNNTHSDHIVLLVTAQKIPNSFWRRVICFHSFSDCSKS